MYFPYIDRTISITTSEVFLPGFEPTTKVHFTPAIDHYANGGIIIYLVTLLRKLLHITALFTIITHTFTKKLHTRLFFLKFHKKNKMYDFSYWARTAHKIWYETHFFGIFFFSSFTVHLLILSVIRKFLLLLIKMVIIFSTSK